MNVIIEKVKSDVEYFDEQYSMKKKQIDNGTNHFLVGEDDLQILMNLKLYCERLLEFMNKEMN